MIDLAVSKEFLTVSTPKYTFVVPIDVNSSEEKTIDRTEPSCETVNDDPSVPSTTKSSDDIYDGSAPVVSSCFSPCERFFICCSHKYLSVWNVNNWSILCKKTISRSVSKILFTGKSFSIVVADKSGDVYCHSLNEFKEGEKLLLGHVSMLLDVLVTPDERFIITCDRDEKIRVSLFPNAYNIHSFCLGHEDFVTSIKLLPSDSNILLSTGGDGTFRLWNYANGKELLCYSVMEDVFKNKNEKSTDNDYPVIIYNTSVLKFDNDSSVACSLIYKSNVVWVYKFTAKLNSFSCNLLNIIKTEFEICSLISNKLGNLWFIQNSRNEPLQAFKLVGNDFIKDESDLVKKTEEIVKRNLNEIENDSLQERQMSLLCKKKFDNEGEYYKRKKERLEIEIRKQSNNGSGMSN